MTTHVEVEPRALHHVDQDHHQIRGLLGSSSTNRGTEREQQPTCQELPVQPTQILHKPMQAASECSSAWSQPRRLQAKPRTVFTSHVRALMLLSMPQRQHCT